MISDFSDIIQQFIAILFIRSVVTTCTAMLMIQLQIVNSLNGIVLDLMFILTPTERSAFRFISETS